MSAPDAFAMRGPDGRWEPCDDDLNRLLVRGLEDLAGLPHSVTVRDGDGEAHVLSREAGHVLYLAALAMDARLRGSGSCYRKKADQIYAILAGGPSHEDGVQELRRVFQLGARRPWLVREPREG